MSNALNWAINGLHAVVQTDACINIAICFICGKNNIADIDNVSLWWGNIMWRIIYPIKSSVEEPATNSLGFVMKWDYQCVTLAALANRECLREQKWPSL